MAWVTKIYYLEPLRPSEGTLASTPVSRRVGVRQAAGRKYKCRSDKDHNMMKTCCTDPTSWDKGRKKNKLLKLISILQFHGELTSGRLPVVKITAESLSQHNEKHVVPTSLSGIWVGRRLK
jgi:hypothetical protein